ncbi:MAG: hemolysin family protein [Anaerolineales bacterium]|nr:hemolysin family protein [Anaerolineales bacterium]
MNSVWNELFIIFLLILFNGTLALSEAAMLSARKARLQQYVNEGKRRAQTALRLVEAPNKFLSTIQIGITVTDILTGAITGALAARLSMNWLAHLPALAEFSAPIGVGVGVIVTSYFSIVLGELVPKRLALQNPEGVASIVAGPMSFLSTLFSPFVWLLSKSTDLILRLLGIQQVTEIPVTEEELLVQLDQGTQAGIFEETEQDMVEGVFSLSDRRVNALMTPRNEIVWLDIHDTAEEIRRKIAESPYSRFPVGEDSLDRPLGVVKAKDVLLANIRSGKDLEKLVRPPIFIPETAFGSRALEMFRETRHDLMLVVAEFGVVQGLSLIHI